MLKKLLLAGVIFGALTIQAVGKDLKVLMIGNSFSVCVGVYLPSIVNSFPKHSLELTSAYIGGCTLEKHAAKAADELKRAREAQDKNDSKTAQKHLDNAVRELGGDPRDGTRAEKPEKPDDGRSGEKNKDGGEKRPAPAPAEQKARPEERKGAEQLLKLLNDEEKQRRGELRKVRDARRPQVEKDW